MLARAELEATAGNQARGWIKLANTHDGVHLRGEVDGLRAGSIHGFHVHEKGDCSAADASSAGGHFNPGGQPHGKVAHGSHHAGDMDNIIADARGRARVDIHLEGVSLASGMANSIAGRAIVVHAAPDDYRSQPAGNAGARLACGVISVNP
nr:superoxide dismutase family protein [Rhodanobacter denitrificans]